MNKQQQQQQQATEQATTYTYSPAELVKMYGGTKSGAIRALLAAGNTRGQVAKMLNIRYQHVRNVDITPIKKQATK